jgi:hypothetical protein
MIEEDKILFLCNRRVQPFLVLLHEWLQILILCFQVAPLKIDD